MKSLASFDLDRLEALARAATPGERVALPREDPDECDGIYISGTMEALVKTDAGVYPPEMPDARFIAACDVETILSLISEIRGWRTATGIERTAGPARCTLVEPEEPLIGRAEPAPPVKGRVSYRVDRLVPAEEIALFPSAFEYHGEEMLAKLVEGLRAKQLADVPYRIRISVEPEE